MSDNTKHILQALIEQLAKVVAAMPDMDDIPPTIIPDQDDPPPPESSDNVYGLKVVKSISGFRIVDVRPIIAEISAYDADAKATLALAKATTPLADVGTPRWKTFAPSAAQTKLANVPIPATAKVFYFPVKKASEVWVVVGLWWNGLRWTGARIGVSRENECDHVYDFGGNDWITAGGLYKDWSPHVKKTVPMVVVLMDYYKKAVSYGVVL